MKKLTVALCFFAFTCFASAQSLDAVLARMDQAAPDFRGVSANVRMAQFTAILSDTTNESGTFEMQKQKNGDVRALLKLGSQWLFFERKTVRIYYPKVNAYQDYDMGKNLGNALNSFLLLGFGTSGKQLAQSYNIKFEGTEKVAGQDTSKLLLVPKDKKVLEHLDRVEVWIPANGANPVQQQFYEPSGNWRKLTYSNTVLNPPVHGVLELQLPPGAKKQG